MDLTILTPQFIVGLSFLIILSLIDFLTVWKKDGYIPSIITTMFLIISFLFGLSTVYIAILGALITLLFVDLQLFDGIADFKTIVAAGMLFPTIFSLLIFMTIITIISVATKTIIFKFNSKMRFPFIPIVLIAYIIAWGLTLWV